MSDDSPRLAPPDIDGGHQVVIVTGLSGAGKTTVLQVLEDLGYETVDNFPVRLVSRFLAPTTPHDNPIALGFDSRTRGFEPAGMVQLAQRLAADPSLSLTTVFLDCNSDELERRYNETRRRHPLGRDRPLRESIEAERAWLAPLRERADLVIDSSGFSVSELQQRVRGQFTAGAQAPMQVTVTSFGFARGMPPLADLVFDVRFLANPHWEPALKEQTGLDAAVGAFVAADPAFAPALDKICDLLDLLLPRYAAQGRSYLTIAIGCTGGKHRSVYTVERIAAHLRATGFSPTVVHRNLALDVASRVPGRRGKRVAKTS